MQQDEVNPCPVHSSVKAAFPIASIEKFTGSLTMDGEIDAQTGWSIWHLTLTHIIVQLLMLNEGKRRNFIFAHPNNGKKIYFSRLPQVPHAQHLQKKSTNTWCVCRSRCSRCYSSTLSMPSYMHILNLKLHLEAGRECNIGGPTSPTTYFGDPLRMQQCNCDLSKGQKTCQDPI